MSSTSAWDNTTLFVDDYPADRAFRQEVRERVAQNLQDIGLYYKRAVAPAAGYGGELSHTGRFSQLTLGVRA